MQSILRSESMEEINGSIEVAKLLNEVLMLLRNSMTKGFEGRDITAPQGMVIAILSRHGKMKISELSKHMGLSISTVSSILDRLEKSEVVTRERSVEDRRVVYVVLADKFKEIHKDVHKKAEENIENIMSKGTPGDLDKVREGLSILKRLLAGQ
jgi:MarR family transcriptional regulator, organic hydroperoxide resistance regulator